MKDIGTVSKDQKNAAQGFKFRGIDQFVNALYPALTKHGVFMTPRVTSINQEAREVERSSGKKGVDKTVMLMVEYDFFAEDGSKVTVGPVAGEGLDSGDKATNKALSAALKYALIQTFSIPTEDMVDADKESPELSVKPKTSWTAKTSGTTIDATKIATSETKVVIDEKTATTAPAATVAAAPKKVSFSRKSVTT